MRYSDFLNIADIGRAIREDRNWKNNKNHFPKMTKDMAEQYFKKITEKSLKLLKENELIELFYGTVALEYIFNLCFGSVTPTVKILKELGGRDPAHFETHGNWAAANRGDNPYTPFGYRYGFIAYQDFLNHKLEIKEREKNDLENARLAREKKKASIAQQHQERLMAKETLDEKKRASGLLPLRQKLHLR